MEVITQEDDSSRNALNEFMRERDRNLKNVLKLLCGQDEHWKARVFLEMLWTIEVRRALEGDESDSLL